MLLYCVPSAPEVPLIYQSYSKHSDSITVEFGVVSGATSYIIRAENENGFFSESLVNTSPGTVVGLLPYTQYTLSVMSVNTGGRSQPSLTVNTRTGKMTFIKTPSDRFKHAFRLILWLFYTSFFFVFKKG